MIAGLERFRDFFKGYEEHYILIGGVATMHWLEDAGIQARATKDLDIVLIVEKLDDHFLQRFWEFVKAGNYANLHKSAEERTYYRFAKAQEADYPFMIEIFSRVPENLSLWNEPSIIPIPAGEDASSLSAILMDQGYYALVRENLAIRDGLPLLSPASLILLKAKAWLDLSARKKGGEAVDTGNIKKHRNDAFKLSLLLTQGGAMRIPASIHNDLHGFLEHFPADSPDWESIRQSFGSANRIPTPTEILNLLTQFYVPAE